MEDRLIPMRQLWPFDSYITLEDVCRTYPPILDLDDEWKPQYSGPVVALGRAVYETQPQEATDNLLKLVGYFHRSLPPGNFWTLRTYERLPYPYAVYWPLANAFSKEKATKRRFDWFIWIDDDVLVSPQDIMLLMKAADPDKRPFVSALPYDRFEPHAPAVTEEMNGTLVKWVQAPPSGVYPCHHVGLCLAVFHRSLFDRVPEPWFAAMPPVKGFSGLAPDWWWSMQMHKAGLVPYVCCDTNVIHLGRKLHVEREYSEQWQATHPRMAEHIEMVPGRRKLSPASGATVVEPIPIDDARSDNADKDARHIGSDLREG